MRTCSRCKKLKTDDDYYSKGNQCKECRREKARNNVVKLNPFPPPKTYEDYLREAGYDPCKIVKIW